MDPATYGALDARLSALERLAAALRHDLIVAAGDASAPPAPAPATEVAPPRPAAAAIPIPAVLRKPAAPTSSSLSLEGLLAGRGLQFAGLLLVLLGVAFFLELAFTRGWIGPRERILLGLIGGSGVIAFGVRALRGSYAFLAEGLIALGAGILYLSLWSSVAVFPQLHVSRTSAFLAMIGVTAFVGVLAAVHRRERLAVLGLLGGLLTPVLLGGGPVNHPVLAAYLLVLDAGMLLLALRCRFRAVAAIAFVGSCCYAVAFAPDGAHGWTEANAYVVASLFFLAFALGPSLAAIRDADGTPFALGVVVADTLVYALVLEELFSAPDRQTTLAVALLGLAALLIVAAQVRALPRALAAAYGYVGLGAVTLALPAVVRETSLLDAFSLEAGILVAIGRRSGDRWIALAGALLFALTGVALFFDAALTSPERTLANPLTYAFLIWIAALLLARSRSIGATLAGAEKTELRVASTVALNVIVLIALSRELLDAIGGPQWNQTVPSNAQLALSLLWSGYAALLFALGLRRGASDLRWQGLILFGVTLAKVFFVDLALLAAEYRVASFVGLGIVMVAASAWYTRSTMRRAKEPEA